MDAGARAMQEQLPRNLLSAEAWVSLKIPRFAWNDKHAEQLLLLISVNPIISSTSPDYSVNLNCNV